MNFNHLNFNHINKLKLKAVCTSERLLEVWFCSDFNRLHS